MVFVFDTSLSFADIVPGYWERYDRSLSLTKSEDLEVEGCPLLKRYQYELYNGRRYIGRDGAEHVFTLDRELTCGGLRFSSDSITVSYRFYSGCRGLVSEAIDKVDGFEDLIRDFVRSTYTIGGEIIFPKHRNSVNQRRGMSRKIGDRLDLTLKAIESWYEGCDPNSYELGDCLDQRQEIEFFGMFRDFEEFCRFFFLDDMIRNGRTVLFCELDDGSPFPKDTGTYLELLKNQRIFVDKRSARMKEYFENK